MLSCSVEQALDEKLTTAVDNVVKSLPSEHQSKMRSELLQRLLEHSHVSDSHRPSSSFTYVLICAY